MTHARKTEVEQLSLLIGGLIAISSLMTIAVFAATSSELAIVAGLALLAAAAAGRRLRVPPVLVLSTAAFGAVLLFFGVMRMIA